MGTDDRRDDSASRVVQLRQVAPSDTNLCERLQNVVTLFKAIEVGELLSAYPDCPVAREHHRAGLMLLGVIEGEIGALFRSLRQPDQDLEEGSISTFS